MKGQRLIGFWMTIILTVLLISSGALAGQQNPGSSGAKSPAEDLKFSKEKAEIEAFVLAFCKATTDRDPVALAKLLADDYAFTAPTGATQNKEQTIKAAMTVAYYKSYGVCADGQTDNCYSITIVPDSERPKAANRKTAIIKSRFLVTGVLNGNEITGEYQATQTLVKQSDGRWLAVAGGMTDVSPAASTEAKGKSVK